MGFAIMAFSRLMKSGFARLQIEYLPYLDDWFVQRYRGKFDALRFNRKTG